MRKLIYISTIVLLSLSSCSKKKELISTIEEQAELAPTWVQNRPISSFDYIGIGKASKRGTADEYQAIARRNALNDMASEIDVTVTSNSLLYTLERNDMLTESFSESIITRSNLRLEGFEVTDDFSDNDYYWVYYRLDKSLYESIKEQRKQQAIERAEQVMITARQAKEDGDISAAAGRYVDVLREMQPYWGEINTSSDGQAIDRSALDELVNMRSDYSIGVEDDIINLGVENGFEHRVEIRSSLNGQLTKPVPFEYRFDKNAKEKLEADRLNLTITPGEKTQSLLSIVVDPFKDLRKEVKREGMTFLEDILKPEIALIDIYTVYPLVTVSAEEEDVNGIKKQSPVLRSAIVKQLAYHGIGVDDSGNSPYAVTCHVTSRDGGLAQNFQIVYSDVTLEASLNDENTLYSTRLESVKGVHRDIENATKISLENCAERIDNNALKPLLDAMF